MVEVRQRPLSGDSFVDPAFFYREHRQCHMVCKRLIFPVRAVLELNLLGWRRIDYGEVEGDAHIDVVLHTVGEVGFDG